MPRTEIREHDAGDVDSLARTQVAPAGSQSTGAAPSDLSLEDRGFAERYGAGETLGAGGMGEVVVCHDRRIGRDVALKRILPAWAGDAHIRARFVREARVQGFLEHPAVVPVYDLGLTVEGNAYFTMKRVRGITLEQVLASLAKADGSVARTYSRRKLLTELAQVCLAVELAHDKGLVHRDLKPGNVMFGDFGEVYVLDWGLAKVRGETGPEARRSGPAQAGLTSAGALLGTPGYLAPEQARGEEVDERADVYALGALLFEILALRPLHEGPNAEALIASTLRGADARVSVRAPERDAPPELETLCVRATALDPRERPARAREMHDAIERYLDGDRDLERRRALAAGHVELAEGMVGVALSTSPHAEAARQGALKELGQALALDPSNDAALRALVRLLTEAPRTLPREVEEALETTRRRTSRVAGRYGTVGFLSMLGFLPVVAIMGVRSRAIVAACAAMILLGAGASWALTARRPASPATPPRFPRVVWALILLSSFAIIAGTSRIFGPLVATPTLAAGLAMIGAFHPLRTRMATIVALGVGGFLAPLILEQTGVLPASYVTRSDALCIVPQMTSLPLGPSIACLAAMATLTIVAAVLSVGRLRDALNNAERRLHLQAWQLQQLVPARLAGPAEDPGASRL
jgi:serine/threonine-protein kinase